MIRWIASAILSLSVLFFAAAAVQAAAPAALDKPTGEVVLTVKGKIANMNADDSAQFDMAMLRLAGRKAVVETPWTKGKVTFEGPLGKALLDAVGGAGKTMRSAP